MFGDFIRSLGFRPTRADQNVWYKVERKTRKMTYISTYVDDFMIIGMDPGGYMESFKRRFMIRNIETDPSEYLGT